MFGQPGILRRRVAWFQKYQFWIHKKNGNRKMRGLNKKYPSQSGIVFDFGPGC